MQDIESQTLKSRQTDPLYQPIHAIMVYSNQWFNLKNPDAGGGVGTPEDGCTNLLHGHWPSVQFGKL